MASRRDTLAALHGSDLAPQGKMTQENSWTLKSTSEIVEAAVHMLAEAAEFRLCYRESWGSEGTGEERVA